MINTQTEIIMEAQTVYESISLHCFFGFSKQDLDVVLNFKHLFLAQHVHNMTYLFGRQLILFVAHQLKDFGHVINLDHSVAVDINGRQNLWKVNAWRQAPVFLLTKIYAPRSKFHLTMENKRSFVFHDLTYAFRGIML